MHQSFRVITVLSALAAWVMTGCSTPRHRAHEHPAAFQRLSAEDQALALRGRVRLGMSQEAVYIAWGEPDQKALIAGGKARGGTERWIYVQRVTVAEPQNSEDYFGPHQGLGGIPAGLPPHAGDDARQTGNEALLWFQPHVRSLDTWRVAEFQGDMLGRFRTPSGK